MRSLRLLVAVPLCGALVLILLHPVATELPAAPAPSADSGTDKAITWKKTVLDKDFRAEGVAVADVNRDGKLDILTREIWYEAPDWKPHNVVEKPTKYDPHGYSHCFACWAEDLNHDGWLDLIVIDFPGTPCYWLENPQSSDKPWKQHTIWSSACNETPAYVDLLGNGKRVLLMGWETGGKGQMAYFTPDKDPNALWKMHPISKQAPGTPGTNRFSHGLGAGDLNGDGRLDVMCIGGWWEQPKKVTDEPWTFHKADLGPDCADMYAFDMDGDGKTDVLSSSAHGYGIWWHQQQSGGNGPTFVRRDLFPKLVSQTHALHFDDINGDGRKDLVTGKRWWAHGPRGDAEPSAPAKLFWFEARKNKEGFTSFVPHVIDDDSGIGTQFAVTDVNGDKLLDVVVANKKGVFLFEQVRGKK